MKIVKEVWSDEKREFVKTEISEREAVEILSCFYNNASDMVKIPNYYRLPYGGIEVCE